MLIDPITKLYEPCPWCGGQGCYSCDRMRVENAQLIRKQQEAGDFLRAYLKATGQPEDTPISIEVALLVINAIDEGKETVRRELREESTVESSNRFTFIEMECYEQADAKTAEVSGSLSGRGELQRNRCRAHCRLQGNG